VQPHCLGTPRAALTEPLGERRPCRGSCCWAYGSPEAYPWGCGSPWVCRAGDSCRARGGWRQHPAARSLRRAFRNSAS